MSNGNKASTWWIAIAATVFIALAGFSLHASWRAGDASANAIKAGTDAETAAVEASNKAIHEAHLVQGRFDEYVSGAKERENMMIYRLEQVEKSIAGMETKIDELLKRE